MRTHLAAVKARAAVDAQPYFVALRDGGFPKDDFVETQVQFLFAVVHFARPMALLAARLPRPEQRLSVLTNVWDEHGGGALSRSHEATFLELLSRLGAGAEEVDARAQWPEVRAFNTLLTGVCAHDDAPTALATLGVIEDLFAGISARLGRALVDNGWLRQADVVHYRTHEVLDVSHAEDFYRLVEPLWAQGARERYQVEQGLELGASAFMQLYRGLWEGRARRWRRDCRGPHSLADGWHVPPRPVGVAG